MTQHKAIVRPLATELTAFEIYLLFKDEPYSFFLESGVLGQLGRYSFIGGSPFLIFRSKGTRVEIREEDNYQVLEGNPFDLLFSYFNQYQIENNSELPFVGGAVGYFGYDLNRQIEKLPELSQDDRAVPDCILGFYDGIVIYDHVEKKVYLTAAGLSEKNAESALAQAEEKLKKLADKLKQRVPEIGSAFPQNIELHSNFSHSAYLRTVQKCLDYIYAGDIYQVNLTQRFIADYPEDPLFLYSRLRQINPAPFAAFLRYPDLSVVSSSPERFLKVHQGLVETRPIKGTRRRGKNPAEDQGLREELRHSEKDQAELVMIVDLQRNDLGRVCEPGSVKVTELFTIEEYATVFHLVATVQGQVKKEYDLLDLLKATFPGGSITGAPKIRAMEIIEELEPTRRGIYTGSIGYLGFDGSADLNIVIRTIIVKDGKAFFQVGGGIVADSDPELEFQETLTKGKALIKALGGKSIEEAEHD